MNLDNALGSRPARRTASRNRTICAPFHGFSGGMQSRHALPAWFGVGYALDRFVAQGDQHKRLLQEMFSRFALFNDLIRNVELAMAKADLAIAKLYASLVREKGCVSACGK